MELGIAIGIGLWFVIVGVVSYISVSCSFKNSGNKEEDK